jgi:hypothetical protein
MYILRKGVVGGISVFFYPSGNQSWLNLYLAVKPNNRQTRVPQKRCKSTTSKMDNAISKQSNRQTNRVTYFTVCYATHL